MNFKNGDMELSQEIKLLNAMKEEIEFVSHHKNINELEIMFSSDKLKYKVKFYLDTAKNNNNFFKKDFTIVSSEYIEPLLLNQQIRAFDEKPKNTLTLSDYFISLSSYLHSSILLNNNYKLHFYNESVSFLQNENYFYSITIFINVLSVLIQIATGLYGYSGEGDKPKFGDFEAQRHWMELTSNLNISQWYTNSTLNPSNYWPIDYPPMSAYHAYLCGMFLKWFMPDSVEFYKSRGYEGALFKIIMRMIAVVSDLAVYHIGAVLLCKVLYLDGAKNKNKYMKYYIMLFIILVSPSMIIIDHGHYQFNNVMHGLYLLAVYFLFKHQIIFAIIFFAMCINFKQMGMYYAIPFPLYALKYLFTDKDNNIFIIFIKLVIYLVVTIASILAIWSPWIITDTYKNVLQRIFPIWRGIFEDKVATFWCVLNIVYKVDKIPQQIAIKASFVLTVSTAVIPAICILFGKKCSKKVTKLGFFIISLGFYLFSFHVHEKTIIVPYLAYLLCFFDMKLFLPSFTMVSMFSMEPMLERENQVYTYIVLTVMFYIISKALIEVAKVSTAVSKKEKEVKSTYMDVFMNLVEILIIIFIIMYHVTKAYIPPPQKYPYIYPLVNAVASFGYFCFIFLSANITMISSAFK